MLNLHSRSMQNLERHLQPDIDAKFAFALASQMQAQKHLHSGGHVSSTKIRCSPVVLVSSITMELSSFRSTVQYKHMCTKIWRHCNQRSSEKKMINECKHQQKLHDYNNCTILQQGEASRFLVFTPPLVFTAPVCMFLPIQCEVPSSSTTR